MNDQEKPESFAARQERQKAKGINGNGMGMPLAMAARTWPTPTTRDHKGGGDALIRSDGKIRNDMLDWVAEKWATPRVEIARALGNPKHITPTRANGNLEDQVVAVPSFRLDQQITTDGEESSHIRRTLNPLFVEWLMGWPPGWTFLGLTPPASSGCACSVTALSRFRADMRSALSSLGTPPAAPPEQPSFL